MEDGTNIKNVLEICYSRRNEGRTTVVMNKSSEPFSCDYGEQCDEQVGDWWRKHSKFWRIVRFGNNGKYPNREQHLTREWWKNHILPQHGKEHAI